MRPGWVTWAGLGVVLAAAAVLSFHALRDLALAVGIPTTLGWLLPIAIDAGAAVSCSAWLSRRCPPDAARFARTMTFGLLVLTVAGNAAQLGMHAAAIVPPWWVAVAVGAIPPAVVGSAVHLAVLAARGVSAPPELAEDEIDAEPWDEEVPDWWADAPPVSTTTSDSGSTCRTDRAVELIAQGVGRRRLAKELGVSEHQAREFLRQHRVNGVPQ
ncbi:DUF2637 domain-containing protein [Pseudonocardia dioxanivorans]|jgi:hypothetical protein|uniref:DUF2637 domain-containing protein n=1 Tax=Pseudonocardia dioxanivorans TaxID=240495 RepID=UPI000CD1EA42|nr:DUF2637 domain-containing protein [Pseudonocardia dioxanivorans]